MRKNQSGLTRDAAQGRGRVQCTAWEAMVFADGLATTTQVIDHVYADKRLKKWDYTDGGLYRQLRVRLDAIADRVGRSRGAGRAWLWRVWSWLAQLVYYDMQ